MQAVKSDDLDLLTPKDVAQILRLSPDAVRQMFRGYPGVIKLAGEKRPLRTTLRIPRHVLERFIREKQVA